jgi:serine/threonine-protein kinase ATR
MLLREDDGRSVHVDFNCIFDRAKTLAIGETVPFRMTQNVVDGLGVLKANGGLKGICKFVFATLNAKQVTQVALLRPFPYDPLLEWKKDGESAMEQTAKNTLQEVTFRLKGFSEDRSAVQAPECTVNGLIEEATNLRTLAILYRGWRPYM